MTNSIIIKVGCFMKIRRKLIIESFIVSLLFFFFFPIAILLLNSFSNQWVWPQLLPSRVGLKSFVNIFTAEAARTALLNSICISIAVTLCTLALSLPASRALGLYDFRGKSLMELIVLSPLMIPAVVLGTGIHVFFIRIGLANSFAGIVVIHLIPCLPYGIRLLTDVYKAVGSDLELQARVLGASPLKAFLRVTLPLLMPGIISAGSFIFVVSFSQYFLTMLIGGGRIITLPMIMFPFIQSGEVTIAAALSCIFILTNFFFIILMEKSIKHYYKTEDFLYL